MKNLYLLATSLNTFQLGVTRLAKHRSNSVAKSGALATKGSFNGFFLFRWFRFFSHNLYLSILISYLIVHPIIAISSSLSEPPTLKCPDTYAYEVEPNTYVRCEDFDLYHELAPHNQHLTVRFKNGNK